MATTAELENMPFRKILNIDSSLLGLPLYPTHCTGWLAGCPKSFQVTKVKTPLIVSTCLQFVLLLISIDQQAN